MQFDEYSAGAENDLKEATALARRMVTRWGMSQRLGPVAYGNNEEQPFLGREMAHEHRTFSERTAQIIDEEIAKILHAAADRATRILSEHRDKLDVIAAALLQHEVLDADDMRKRIGPSVSHVEHSGGGPAVQAATTRAERSQQPESNKS